MTYDAPHNQPCVAQSPRFRVPIELVARSTGAAPTPISCMIVEDQALIGMALELSLQEAGFATVGPFARQADALASLKISRPDIALLDVMLQDGPCLELARSLRAHGTPFAIYSGVRPPQELPAEFVGAPWLEKPASREALIRALTKLAHPQRPQTFEGAHHSF